MNALLVFVGAGLGGVARYAVGAALPASAFPWATLLVNVTGSILLGLLYSYVDNSGAGAAWRLFAGVGLCGGYTTFSTFSYESVRLLQDGHWSRAVMYVMGSVLLSVLGVWLGMRLGQR